MKKLIALLASAALALGLLAAPAFADEIGEGELADVTMREAQAVFLEYLESRGLQLQVGTQEYYNYICQQLSEHTDAELLASCDYELIRAYMAEYKAMYEDFLLASEHMQLGGQGALDETN